MKKYELTEEQVKMIVESLSSSIDAMAKVKNTCEQVGNLESAKKCNDYIIERTTLKNYLEQC